VVATKSFVGSGEKRVGVLDVTHSWSSSGSRWRWQCINTLLDVPDFNLTNACLLVSLISRQAIACCCTYLPLSSTRNLKSASFSLPFFDSVSLGSLRNTASCGSDLSWSHLDFIAETVASGVAS